MPLRLNAAVVILIRTREQSMWSADADAGEVGLPAGYFCTVAAGYNAS